MNKNAQPPCWAFFYFLISEGARQSTEFGNFQRTAKSTKRVFTFLKIHDIIKLIDDPMDAFDFERENEKR